MHEHEWTLSNAALHRYRCACGVVGYKHPLRGKIDAYTCQRELGDRNARYHCGKPATHVLGSRTSHRCAEHAP